MSLKKVVAHIKRNKHFLITTHTNPEGDALGSELALLFLLDKLGKRAVIANEDEVPYEYSFLPGAKRINKFKEALKAIDFDCSFILDCSDLKRCGDICSLNLVNKPIINIDHHISNEKFGDINWVEPYASACAELIYKLYKELAIPFDKDTATLLYTGIMTDTGSFHYSNTTSFTHKIASDLLKHKLDVPQIYNKIYGSIPYSDVQLLTRILPSMNLLCDGKIAWFQIKRSILKNRKITFDLTEHILTFGRSIRDVEVVVLFKENPDTLNSVRVNLRSHGKVDVNKVARAFGGGGHKTASGCTIHGELNSVRKAVLKKIKESL